jgi:hypothetical protein
MRRKVVGVEFKTVEWSTRESQLDIPGKRAYRALIQLIFQKNIRVTYDGVLVLYHQRCDWNVSHAPLPLPLPPPP